MMDGFLACLNLNVPKVYEMPRVRFEVGLGDAADGWLRKKHAGDQRHEPGTIAAMLAAVDECYPFNRHSPRFFDCGALFGYFGLLMEQIRPMADVTAFEMHPAVIGPLRENLMPWHKVVHCVLSDQCCQQETFWVSGFNIFEKPPGGWQMLADDPQAMKQRGPNNRGAGYAVVDFLTLDAYCNVHGAPDLIKIDVEGYQAKAIRGGLDMFGKYRPCVIVELHEPEKLARFGTTNAQTVQPLLDLGYAGYWCGNHRDRDATFEAVTEMTDRHERLSIMALVPR